MFAHRDGGSLDAMNSTEVTTTLKDMWETRPVRPAHDRKVAGVGAAIARRYDLDPVLVRVGLVAAAFTGVGLAFYVLAWALLPGEPGARRPRFATILLFGVLTVAGIGSLANSRGGVLLPVAALAVLLFLLHRNRADRGLPGPGRAAGATGPRAPDAAVPADGTTPPAWDPLGAAPFAWDLPEPGPAPDPVPPRRRSRVTAITLAAALLAGGVTGLVMILAGPTGVPVLLGVVLTVLGGGLLVGSFLHTGRGIIPFALLASAVTWGVLAAPFDRFDGPGAGDVSVAPTSAAEIAPVYRTDAGDLELDLRGVDLAVPPGTAAVPITTRLEAGAGSIEVRVPENADVRFTGSVGVGSVEFEGQDSSGPDARLTVDDLGADGVASGRPIVLDAHAGVGSVEVRRG
jgi:phage shock protein PspC (stress-responsive transcriptional regulator)